MDISRRRRLHKKASNHRAGNGGCNLLIGCDDETGKGGPTRSSREIEAAALFRQRSGLADHPCLHSASTTIVCPVTRPAPAGHSIVSAITCGMPTRPKGCCRRSAWSCSTDRRLPRRGLGARQARVVEKEIEAAGSPGVDPFEPSNRLLVSDIGRDHQPLLAAELIRDLGDRLGLTFKAGDAPASADEILGATAADALRASGDRRGLVHRVCLLSSAPAARRTNRSRDVSGQGGPRARFVASAGHPRAGFQFRPDRPGGVA